jgi:hypothetical protein
MFSLETAHVEKRAKRPGDTNRTGHPHGQLISALLDASPVVAAIA